MAGKRFIAITDPGTPLEKLAEERNFRATFRAPEDVGGRYSAFTNVGLLPAMARGLDARAVRAGARDVVAALTSLDSEASG